jgi:outer membrane receptor protein involved in Fe transport
VNTSPPVQPGSLSTVDKSYALLDLRAGLISSDGHWHIQVFGDNVTNTYYWTGARLTGDSVVRFTGMPMTYGVTVGYKY